MLLVHFAVCGSLLGLSLSAVIARDEPATTTTASPAQSTICGDIINAANDDGSLVFFASDVYECFTSVPFNAAVATRFIEYYNTTLQFQSTLAYLKNPPQGYQQPAADILQGLQHIQQNITAGHYTNEYTFEADVQLLVYALHDAHVTLTAGALSAFSFASPYSISSASVDGKQPPQVFITDDIIASQQEGWQPSPIVSINGQDVVSYLTQFAALNSVGNLEPHADWNQLMDAPALDVQGYLPIFSGSATFYPGDALNFTFANGTELPTFWLALYNNQDPTGPLTTGGDFYNYFVLGLLPASFNSSQTDNSAGNNTSTDNSTLTDSSIATTSWFNASAGAYPEFADIFQPDLSVEGGGVVTGYFLNDTSTGVLSLPSFDQYDGFIGNFSDTVANFIVGAKAANLSRVIIDLQQNSGGNIELAFDTFKQFFPDIDPFAGSRRRSHQLANVLGDTLTAFWDSLPVNNDTYDDFAADEWVITDRLNAITGMNFTSWAEYFGPLMDNGDTFSLVERYNLSSEIFDIAAFDGWIPYGYTADNPVHTSRPWNPEDIVVLTDGLCSSTCSLFLEMMTHQAGVRTIAVGGRPETGPMQVASGSRGALAYSADYLDSDFVEASSVNDTASALLPQNRDPGIFIISAGFNLRDQIRLGDPVPLQFKFEAADCRLYYTLANVYNMSRLWRDVASAAWDDPSLCVANSTGFPTAANNTATNPPPAPNSQSPSLDPGSSKYIDFAVEETGGLTDGRQTPSRKSGIQLCLSNGKCADGVSSCQSIVISCQSGGSRTVSACLPPCQNRDGNDSCTGTNTFCDVRNVQESKVNTLGGKGASPKLGATLRTGVCVPRVGTPQLGCPA